MNSRRSFLKNAALLSGAAGLPNVIPMSIQKAMAISADPGSTFYDAEHVVFLMQENRSFDHMFGKLKGVRGFNDPRTFTLPNQDKVWLQKDAAGKTYAPFHVDINKTKITWQGGLPHSWSDQLAARNHGKYDKWVPVKSHMCLGYYDRTDVPFYYAMADAFTICDHNFCSSLTGTTPNRLFFWTGTIRPEQNGTSIAAVNNSQAESRENAFVDWDTFPELLEDNDVSWKIYQNEIWTADIQGDTVDDWLGNYGDNAIEYVKRYNVKLAAYFRKNGDKTAKPPLTAAEVTEKYNKLSDREKNLIDKAFASNINAPENYMELAPFSFTDDQGNAQTVNIPKNDIFHQFRSDVDHGKLPTVSWLVAPQRFSDHTSSPLYGTWYVSEAIDILTKNPEVWKKTIFILTYDENDGYFDHIPPYVVPKPGDAGSGKVSEQIDIAPDYELKKDSPIGLGYRVPMLVASPWSKGGYVNSQVFDHTSCLMFLENFLGQKTGKKIKSKNISSWRRAICGDLTSVFRPAKADLPNTLTALKKEAVITGIQNAKNKPAQVKPDALTPAEISKINTHEAFDSAAPSAMPQQEKGTKPACALPYQLFADAHLDPVKKTIQVDFESGKGNFGQKLVPVGAPFLMYSNVNYQQAPGKTWSYAVVAGDHITDQLKLSHFEKDHYHLCISGPNGFFRQFKGNQHDPALKTSCGYEVSGLLSKKGTGNIQLLLENEGSSPLKVTIKDLTYQKNKTQEIALPAKGKAKVIVDLQKSGAWYDFSIEVAGHGHFSKQYAGHVETGEAGITDPFMGATL
ncbi:phospholipase C, phosphocholine-specific [Pedobacter sp. PLR]|uniref:phosphocholine-specific phospholipase C n=1 Tax=Pedobacter sp. PLR TaxID=2994465 RepID=UPI002246C8DE|nr:phospholipase C, phosphocholine-specific [Pedobacter sp. PLR]MCX2450623.1 phospholipase C, phosphocholine-specific [Pedobacter sp. PLR]